MQERTELADTVGSVFTADCLSLVAEARYEELLSRWLPQIDMLLANAQDKGAVRPTENDTVVGLLWFVWTPQLLASWSECCQGILAYLGPEVATQRQC